MTVREKICEAGVSTLRQYLCLENTGGGLGGDIIINSELVVVTEDSEITVVEISDKVDIIEDEIITLVEIDDIIILTIEEKENVDVVC